MKQLFYLTAILLFSSCISKKPSREYNYLMSDSFNIRAAKFLENHQLDSADFYIAKSLLWDSRNCAAYNNRAILKFQKKLPSAEVAADFDTSLLLNPSYEIALFSQANFYNEIKDYKKVIEACNQYNLKATGNDTTHIREIKRLYAKAKKFEKVISGNSFLTAIEFYDSITAVSKKPDSVQNIFIVKLAEIFAKFKKYKNVNTDFIQLNELFETAAKANKFKLESINRIKEIDSAVNYKMAVLNYTKALKNAYDNIFPGFLLCTKTKDLTLIKNCIAAVRPAIIRMVELQKMEILKAKEFKIKYSIRTQ